MFMGRTFIETYVLSVTFYICSYAGMIVREALTVIDHNSNLGRAQV